MPDHAVVHLNLVHRNRVVQSYVFPPRGEPITVGHDPQAGIFAPFRAVPRRQVVIRSKNEGLDLVVTPHLVGHVERDRVRLGLDSAEGETFALEIGDRGKIVLGDATLTFEVERARAPGRSGVATKAAAALLFALVTLAAIAQVAFATDTFEALMTPESASVVDTEGPVEATRPDAEAKDAPSSEGVERPPDV